MERQSQAAGSAAEKRSGTTATHTSSPRDDAAPAADCSLSSCIGGLSKPDQQLLLLKAAAFHHCFHLLIEGANYATSLGRPRHEFAVPYSDLENVKLRHNDLRWLIQHGWVEHLRNVSDSLDSLHVIKPSVGMRFNSHSSFTITDLGIEIASGVFAVTPADVNQGSLPRPENAHQSTDSATFLKGTQSELTDHRSEQNRAIPDSSELRLVRTEQLHSNSGFEATAPSKAPPNSPTGHLSKDVSDIQKETPSWDADRHELMIGNTIVKRFRWPAANQESVLSAFEEEGWPSKIDDPLSPNSDSDPKRRLADTIKCLNRNQTTRLIRFRGDGTGEGVLWDYC